MPNTLTWFSFWLRVHRIKLQCRPETLILLKNIKEPLDVGYKRLGNHQIVHRSFGDTLQVD